MVLTQKKMLPKKKDLTKEEGEGSSGGVTWWNVWYHFGINEMLEKVWRHFYWVNLQPNVDTWCRYCDVCGGGEGPKSRTRGEIHQYDV